MHVLCAPYEINSEHSRVSYICTQLNVLLSTASYSEHITAAEVDLRLAVLHLHSMRYNRLSLCAVLLHSLLLHRSCLL
jgi:hypothetical protein